MTIIATQASAAKVQAPGQAMNASVNLAGALMEMLATVYTFILLAAIREAIQNACDAARRNGRTFAEGVQVLLPTPSNPMITIIDKGAGMTKEFMEDPANGYLSYGSSTKSNDDGSVGGLGVGRWAAYGYIRECFISTCHASDMVQRTYFQFQGPNATPQVQLASETPSDTVGTKVYFPVKESDIDEALRAVAWLKEVMQLTMGDSFEVDAPAALPTMLPPHSGEVLDLGPHDASLAGIKVYPMQGAALKYYRGGLQTGSLIVLTNQDAGVGGLPFHVQGQSSDSVFSEGMVIEIPMSYRIPFMPSREEVKYSDEVTSLMGAIDLAATKALLAHVAELYARPSLAAKRRITAILGESIPWHCFARAARTETPLAPALRNGLGGRNWNGALHVPAVAEIRDPELTCKYLTTGRVLKSVNSWGGELAVKLEKDYSCITFGGKRELVLVVDDSVGALARFRAWTGSQSRDTSFLYFAHKSAGKALTAAHALNARFGGELRVVRTSTLPAVTRTVAGSKVMTVKVSGSSLAYYCFTHRKQLTEAGSLTSLSVASPRRRIWVGKEGGQLLGFVPGTTLASLAGGYNSNLATIMAVGGAHRIYLLTPRQRDELEELIAALKRDGVWDLSDEELRDEVDGETLVAAVQAARSWVHLDDLVRAVRASKQVVEVAEGRTMQLVQEHMGLNYLVEALAIKPRMTLTGTGLDRRLAPHVDVLTGAVKLHSSRAVKAGVRETCGALERIGLAMDVTTDDPQDRQDLAKSLIAMGQAGVVDYNRVMKELVEEFPLIGMLKHGSFNEKEADELVKALAALYG